MDNAKQHQPLTRIRFVDSTATVGDITKSSAQPLLAPVADMTRLAPPAHESLPDLNGGCFATSPGVAETTEQGEKYGRQSRNTQSVKTSAIQPETETAMASVQASMVPTSLVTINNGVYRSRSDRPPAEHHRSATGDHATTDTATQCESAAVALPNKQKPTQQPSVHGSPARTGDETSGALPSTSESNPTSKRQRRLSPAAQSPQATLSENSIAAPPSTASVPPSTTSFLAAQADLPAPKDLKTVHLPRRKAQPEIYIEEPEKPDVWIKWPYDPLSKISFDEFFPILAEQHRLQPEQLSCIRFFFVDARSAVSVDIERGQKDGYTLLRSKIMEVVDKEGHEGVFRIHAELRSPVGARPMAELGEF